MQIAFLLVILFVVLFTLRIIMSAISDFTDAVDAVTAAIPDVLAKLQVITDGINALKAGAILSQADKDKLTASATALSTAFSQIGTAEDAAVAAEQV